MDQYLSFIAPSPSLFSLLPPVVPAPSTPTVSSTPQPHSSYALLNSPSSSEQQIEAEIDRIANGLFSAIATTGNLTALFPFDHNLLTRRLGHVPFIRAPRGNAAEMIAKKVETKIRDALISSTRSNSSLFSQDTTGLSTLQRPRLSLFMPLHPIHTHSICSTPHRRQKC